MDLDKLEIGDKVKTTDVYKEDFIIEALGDELTVVGKTVTFLSSSELMNEVKRWKPDFNPGDYE